MINYAGVYTAVHLPLKTENDMQPKTLFLIDDDALTNYIHRRVISSKYNFNIVEFTDPAKALETLQAYTQADAEQLPEVIFVDINMPHMDGWDFLNEYEKLPDFVLEKCEVIVLSSTVNQREIERANTYRVVKGFISKPLSQDALAGIARMNANKTVGSRQ